MAEVGAVLKTVVVGVLAGVALAGKAKQANATRIEVAQADRRTIGLHIALMPFTGTIFRGAASFARGIFREPLRECLTGGISTSLSSSGRRATEISYDAPSPFFPLFPGEICRQTTYTGEKISNAEPLSQRPESPESPRHLGYAPVTR